MFHLLLLLNKPSQTWNKTIYCAHRFCRSDIKKRRSMAVLSLLHDVFGLSWQDSKAGSKGALISRAWNHLKDCSFRCCIRAGRTWRLGLLIYDFSIGLGFLRAWLPQMVRFPTRLQAQVFQWTKQKFIGFYEPMHTCCILLFTSKS